jgi:hypothetical protein
LINDSGEKINIADANPGVTRRLKRQFEKWKASCEKDMSRLDKKD